MGKSFKAQWLGDDDVHTQAVTEGGLVFVKGQSVTVPDDLSHNGMPWADNIRNNPAFAVGDDADAVVEGPEEDERKGAMEELDKRNIPYRTNASLPSLRKLLADKA